VEDNVEFEERRERETKLEKLTQLCVARDLAGIAGWFAREFPRCVELVPPRRREQFARGVVRVYEERQPWE
jgi:hypothetical protein